MVPKKAKSKRLACSQKYKIQKKVKEHHRKQRKEAKKNPNLHHKKKNKDPGIPNLFPFKEKMLQEIEEVKQQKVVEKEQRRLEQKKQSEKAKLMAMVESAAQRSAEFEDEQNDFAMEDAAMDQDDCPMAVTDVHADPLTAGKRDDSKRAYYKEFKKVVEAADVILQVLDVRDPMGCRSKHIEELIMNAGSNKRIILILNKIGKMKSMGLIVKDLVPREVVEQWLKYLRNEFPTIAFKASTQTQRNHLSHSKMSTKHATGEFGGVNKLTLDGILKSSECLGADTLMKLLKNYCRNNHIKSSIRVGVIGFPNVGKSSIINSLKRSRVCTVGSTPGVTKSNQEIHLDKHIKLIDSPGIVFSKSKSAKEAAEAILRNCVKVELVEDPVAPIDVILTKIKREQLMMLYNIPFFESTTDFLIHIARLKGRIRKGGIPDLENAARAVLSDWNGGRIPYYTMPPTVALQGGDTHVSAAIVEGWTREFELPEIVAVEGKNVLDGIKSKSEMSSRCVPMESMGMQQDIQDMIEE